MKRPVINISSQKANLKRKIRRHLRQLGFHKLDDGTLSVNGEGKEVVRALHSYQRNDRLEKNRDF